MKIVFYVLLAAVVGVGGYFGYKKWFAKDATDDTETAEDKKADVPDALKAMVKDIQCIAPVVQKRTCGSETEPLVLAPKPQSIADFMPKPVQSAFSMLLNKQNRTPNAVDNLLATPKPFVTSPIFGIAAPPSVIPAPTPIVALSYGILPPSAPKSVNDRGIVTPLPIIGNGKPSMGVYDRPGASIGKNAAIVNIIKKPAKIDGK